MTGAIILGIIGLILGFAQWKVNSEDQWLANEQAKKFNKDEAEKSRQWQEEQYKKYESVAAQMQQRQQAGLNPYEGITSMSVGSGSTASTSANQISPLSLPDMSVFSQLAKDFSIAEGQGIENQYQKEIFEKRKEKFDADLEALNLSNQQKSFWNKMFEQAYFNDDGTPKEDLNPIKNDALIKKNERLISEYNEQIAHNNQVQDQWRQFLRDCLNFEYDALPKHLQEQVTLHLWRLFARQGTENGAFTEQEAFTIVQLREQITEWIDNEQTQNRHESQGTSPWIRDLETIWTLLSENSDAVTEAFASFVEDRIRVHGWKL